MAEYETPDPDDGPTYEATLAEARADGVDRHAVPSATRYSPPEAGKVAAALHGSTDAELPAYSAGYERAIADAALANEALAAAPAKSTGARAHALPVLALCATVAVQLAQALVAAPPEALEGLSGPVSGAVLTVAQLVVVLAAIYRMGPAR